MRIHRKLIAMILCLVAFAGCGGEESEKLQPTIKEGSIQGKVTDSETGLPIAVASVTMDNQTVITDGNGNYTIFGIPFTDKLDFVVSATEYKDYKGTVSLQQELLILNFNLAPIDSEKARVLEVLEGLSADIEALDPDRIPAIQGRLSKDYTVGDDAATAFGVLAGVIPPSYEGTPEAVEKIIDKYSKIKFTFSEPNVSIKENIATVEMLFEVYAETKPNPPNPAKKWELAIMGKMDLQKEESDWRIIFWQLIGDFLKFKEEPL